MALRSIVQESASAELDRRNARIGLEDTLENSESTRTLQDRQGRASLSQAAAANRQASAAMSSVQQREMDSQRDFITKQSQLALAADESRMVDARERERIAVLDRASNRQADIDERRVSMDEAKLPIELENLSLMNDRDKIAIAGSMLDYQMKSIMHARDMDRLPQIFAYKNALEDAATVGHKSELSAARWGVVARYTDGIYRALEGGNISLANSLREQMYTEADSMGIDISKLPLGSIQLTKGTAPEWKMVRDMAVHSLEVQQAVVKAQYTNADTPIDAFIKYLTAQGHRIKARNDTEDQYAQNIERTFNQIGTVIGPILDVQVNKDGRAAPMDDGKAVPFNNLMSTMVEYMVPNGNQRFPPEEQLAIANRVAQRLNINDTLLGDGLSGTYATQRYGILPNDSFTGPLFKNPMEEIAQVASDSGFKKTIIPSVERMIQTDSTPESIKNALRKVITDMKGTADGTMRSRMWEKFIHEYTLRQETN